MMKMKGALTPILGSIRCPVLLRGKTISIIPVITPAHPLPPRQSTQLNIPTCKPDTDMAFLAFRNNGNFVVVDTAGGGYGMVGAGCGCLFVAV